VILHGYTDLDYKNISIYYINIITRKSVFQTDILALNIQKFRKYSRHPNEADVKKQARENDEKIDGYSSRKI